MFKFAIGGFTFCITNKKIVLKKNRTVMSRSVHRRIKQAVISREESRCQLCGRLLEYKQATIHHIIPISMDVSLVDNLDNIMCLCDKCHREIHCDPFYNVSIIAEHYPEKVEFLPRFKAIDTAKCQ